jgi:DNA-binding ferritin-like protein
MPNKTYNKKRRSQKKKMRTTYKNNKTKDNSNSKTYSKSYSKSNIVRIFLEMLNMIKLYHWKTRSYSQHKATDELYAKMQENVDRFIEVLLGKDESRVKMMEKRIDLFDTESKMEFKSRLLKYRKFLTDLNIYFDESQDSDLLNIRDELLADLNQFLYLFSFNKI